MALETGVKIDLDVTGEKLLKQAFESARLAVKGLDSQGQLLESTLNNLTSAELKTAETFRKSSTTYKGLQKETVTLARQYEFMAKFSGISAREARFLAEAQDDLIKKAKELRAPGNAQTNYLDAQNKKIVEQIRLNNTLKSSIDSLSGSNKTAASEINKVGVELSKVQRQAELAAQGLSKVTANGVIKLQGLGATQSQIEQFIRLRNEIEKLDPAVKRTSASFSGMSGIIRQIIPIVGGISLGAVLSQISIEAIRTADAMTLLKSRMKLTLDAGEDFKQVYQGLIETSVNNRASLTDTVTLFNRLSPALKEAGVQAKSINTVIDSFQKTLLISGATVRETSSAVLQFSQAMAAGRLNGDEFRSISEAAPEFLRAFSKATGVAAGSLKELAAEGKLTTEVITAAMVVINSDLTRAANSIDVTFSQSIVILSTRLSEFVDRVNESSGATQSLAGVTLDIADIFKEVSFALSDLKIDKVNEDLREMSPTVVALGYVLETVAVLLITAANGFNFLVDTVITGSKQMIALLQFNFKAIGELGAEYNQRTKESIESMNNFTSRIVGMTQKATDARSSLIDLRQSLLSAGYGAQEMKFGLDGASDSLSNLGEEGVKIIRTLEDFRKNSQTSSSEVEKLTKKHKDLSAELSTLKTGALATAKAQETVAAASAKELLAKAALIDSSVTSSVQRKKESEDLKAQAKLITDVANLEVQIAKAKAGRTSERKTESEESKKIKEVQKLDAEIKKLSDTYELYGGKLDPLEKLERDIIEAYEKGTTTAAKYTEQILALYRAREDDRELKMLRERVRIATELNEKSLKEARSGAESAEERNKQLEDEIAKLGLKADAIAEVEINTIALRAAELKRRASALGEGNEAEELLREAAALEKQIGLLRQKASKEIAVKQADDLKKEFDKIQDDIAKSITDAIAGGGQKGKDILKNMFKAQVFRIFIEPQVRNVVGSISGALGVPGASGTLDVNSIAGSLGALSTGGGLGLALNSAFKMAGEFSQSAYAFTQVGQQFAGVASGLGQLAPYAGAIASVLQGDIKGGLGSAAGTYIGGAIAGPIGAAIGSFLGSKLGGGGKISASTIDPSNFTEVKKALLEQYKNTVASLGGAVNDAVRFNVYGNTGRQGQNSNFTAFANVGNRSVFSSFDTAEGQADGLFLSGEVALNDKNLADQSLRALFSVLKETDFADNIDAVIKSANTFGDSFEKLNGILSDAQMLNTINTEFPKLGGVLATLANQSIETVKTFVALAGGVENLGSLQSAYIQAIYSEEEKLEIATDNLNKAFASLNLSVPNSTSAFRDLVESQNLSTAQGQATYLALLQVAGAFAEITKANEDLIAATNLRVQQERAELEKELYDLITDNNQKLQDQRNALDESNRSLFDQIQAIKATNALREELTAKIQEQESVISEVEDKIFSIREQATQDYLTAQEKVQAAQERINQLSLETAGNFLNLGKSLRDFIKEQRQGASSGGFNSTLQAALGGDAQALANLPNLAGALIGDLENTSRSSFEAQARKASILEQVSLAAAVAEALGASALQEDPMIVAQRELIAAQSELSNALAVANAINAPLVQTQQNLVTEYTKALGELTAANNNLNALLGTLNLINNGGVVTPSTTIQTPNGVVSLPVAAGSTSASIAAPILEQQIAALTAKVEQLIVENRAGQQAIANNTGKSAKILERADDGDSINVRVLL